VENCRWAIGRMRVYRTIEDLQNIIRYLGESRRCAVIGGGRLGLEAAKAAYDPESPIRMRRLGCSQRFAAVAAS
jgi:hypothetical protein